MNREELINKLQNTNPERVKSYLEILDRMFLQTVIAKAFDQNDIETIIDRWQQQIKTEINFESGLRSDFLMGTPAGRLISTTSQMEDGESLRLTSLGAMDLAKEIARQNLISGDSEEF